MRVRRYAVAVLVSAFCVVACSSIPPPLPIGATPAPYSFTGSLTLSGEIPLQGGFSDNVTLRHETCEQYVRAAAPATTLWVVPTPNNTQSIDGHVVMYTAGVPNIAPSIGFRGPRSYGGVSAIMSVLIVDNASFVPGDSATTTITVSGDGSGSMSFEGLVDTASNAAESGRVQWTCTD